MELVCKLSKCWEQFGAAEPLEWPQRLPDHDNDNNVMKTNSLPGIVTK